ncbi:MAG: histidine--tRNA ligase [Planctomycetota bacterium]|nr:histidine--tRNA ligase [Planctomycetota bacterium]
MSSDRITPRTLKGFRDFLPAAMMQREQIIDTAKQVYRSFGYAPIDTPALEYLEILTGKGSDETDRQMYRFEDAGGRQVGMRFDLTVPLARYCAQHINELGTPFKRYHIAPVWRGENTHRGRYREFMQCDFDTIGSQSLVTDIEVAVVIHELLNQIGISDFTLRINNRQVLNGLLEQLGLRDQATPILRALDKLAKTDAETVMEEMTRQSTATTEQAAKILSLVQVTGTNGEILDQLEKLADGHEATLEGIEALRHVIEGTQAAGVAQDALVLDVSIARGLDYYTGTIYETFLNALPQIGSVCSGGRYDNLTGVYTKQELPGVGASLGLDRLLAAMEELGLLQGHRTPAKLLVTFFDRDRLSDYLRICTALRRRGLAVELFPEPKKLGQQLKYANRQGFECALIAGTQEFEGQRCQIKDLSTGESHDVDLDEQCEQLANWLQSHSPTPASEHAG